MKRILLFMLLLLNLHVTIDKGSLNFECGRIMAQVWLEETLPDVVVIGSQYTTCTKCYLNVEKRYLQAHLEQDCPKRIVECGFCNQTYVFCNGHTCTVKCAICHKPANECTCDGCTSNGHNNSGNSSGNSVNTGNGTRPSGSNNNPNPSSMVKTPQVIINSNVKISKTEAKLVRELLKGLNVNEKMFVVTSCKRTIEQQVKAMLNNIRLHGLQHQLNTYKYAPGRTVIQTYNINLSYDQNLTNMLKVASTVKPPYKLSHHIGIPGYLVFDIAQSTLSKSNINAVIAALKSDPHVVKVLKENNCLHIEYKLD